MGENKRINLQGKRETVFERISGGRTFIYEDSKGLIIIGEQIYATRNITSDIDDIYNDYKEVDINDPYNQEKIKDVLKILNRLIKMELPLKSNLSGEEIIQGKEKLKRYVLELSELEIQNYLDQTNRYKRASQLANRTAR